MTTDLRPPTIRPCLSALRIIGVTIVTYLALHPSRSNDKLKLDGTEPTVSSIRSNLQYEKRLIRHITYRVYIVTLFHSIKRINRSQNSGQDILGEIKPKQTRPECWQVMRCVQLYLTQRYCSLNSVSLCIIETCKKENLQKGRTKLVIG